MKKYCFLMDTSCDPALVKQIKDVYVMPFSIVVKENNVEKSFTDLEDITRDEVFKYFAKNADVKTSQPSVGYIEAKMEELLLEYEKIICIPISKNFSGTYSSCISVKKSLDRKFGKDRILVIDGRCVSYVYTNYILKIKRLLDEGKSLAEVDKEMKNCSDKYCGFTCVTNATQLVKGGRLTGIKALLVKALNLKLVIKFQDGKLDFYDKSTNLYSALDKGIVLLNKELDLARNKIIGIFIYSDLNEEDTKKYTKYIEEKFPSTTKDKIQQLKLPTVIITHLGNNSLTLIIQVE